MFEPSKAQLLLMILAKIDVLSICCSCKASLWSYSIL